MNYQKTATYNLKKKLNLIFFLPNFDLGGAGKSILKLCKNIDYDNYSITIISLGKNYFKNEFLKLRIKIIELKKKSFLFSLYNILNLVKKINKSNNFKSIFISNINYCNVIFPLVLNKSKIETILIERTPIFELDFYKNFIEKIKKKIVKFLIKFSYKKSKLVITNSNFIKKELSNYLPKNKIFTIHPDILITKNFQKKYSKIIKLLWVGRYSGEKNINDLIKSLHFLEDYNFQLTIIVDKNISKIKSQISRTNLKKIKFKKFKNNISKEFIESHVLVITSIYEGFPNVVAEAINYNCLIISSNSRGGIKDLIKNNSYGIFYRLYNPKSLSDKIIFTINNYENLKKIIKKNRKRLINLSNKNRDKYKKVFSKII